jgi:hypothetical protein
MRSCPYSFSLSLSAGTKILKPFWWAAILNKSLVCSNKIACVASKADNLTDWRDVVTHAELASKEGWGVKEVISEVTLRCNHIKNIHGCITKGVGGTRTISVASLIQSLCH